ncbi:hypothetical protein CABS01_10644 [Colletotrichum abscissum]|nr:uncharacterized protein CABS01_10644 [Colletotrichum abscissum]KAK1498869.1 hypothetical protein CABS01_10644 [Colletotrichum abscissum]
MHLHHTYRHYPLTTLTTSPSPTILCPFFQGTMSHNEESSPTESRVVLRTQGMNEVLPRHDLDMFTSAGTYPHGSWELSEVGQPHQFQAAYCVRDAQGQKVRAPIPLVSLSAVTNQEEIYQHCTVYHYDPTCQSRRNTDHHQTASAFGQQQHHLNNALLQEQSSYQPTALDVQVMDQQHIPFDVPADDFSRGSAALLSSPPAYSSIAAQRASPVEKDRGMTRISTHGSNIICFPSDNATSEYSRREDSLVVNTSHSNSYHEALQHSAADNLSGLGLFTPQESLETGVHGENFTMNDSFTTMTLSPQTLSMDEQAFDELFRQRHDASYDFDETNVRGNPNEVGDGSATAKKER